MVGEMRDLETAEIAIRAALTGHLVFSTLHTNDAIGGITRLVDMGVEPFLVAAAVRAFLAQRLVRTLCPHCKQPAHYSKDSSRPRLRGRGRHDHLHSVHQRLHRCRSTGYHGRLAIYEIILLTHAMQELVAARASANEAPPGAQDGYIPMREYGWRKVLEGVTTIEEVMRVTSEDFLD